MSMALIPPVNSYVASQLATQQAKPVTPVAQVVTARPATPAERRERARDKEKQHRDAEQETEDEVEARGKLTDIEA
jgi:hypothetical protein